jgi:acyl-[acyl-carrier-protein]-phospholipid O-acyltransferase/long-chain-fatty-acid--[acyl-carrier-protein] ligase
LFRDRDLTQVNGMIQMTTFLSIIFGMALAGFIKEWYGERLWIGSAMCIGIAVLGTLTSLSIRKTPIARPGLPFTPSSLLMSGETWRMIRGDRPLFAVLIVSSLFWFLGGVIQPTVNAFGKLQLEFGDGRTSILAVCMAIGIMVGCLSAGGASKGRIRFEFVTMGAWGIFLCLIGAAALGSTTGIVLKTEQSTAATIAEAESAPADAKTTASIPKTPSAERAPEGTLEILNAKTSREWIFRGLLTGVGLFAGFFIVPLAVFMQVRPPADQKGRMIGAMNLINWIGILVAAMFYGLVQFLCTHLEVRESWIFAIASLVMLPVALFYRPAAN